MHSNYKRYAAVFIAAVLLVTCAPAALGGTVIQGIGTEVRHIATPLHAGATLHETTLLHTAGSRQEERYIELSGSSPLTAMTVGGATVLNGNLTMIEAAAKLKSQGLEVVAGMNADFYTVSNGIPCGLLITEGIIRCSDNNQFAAGFLSGGGVIIGQPYLNTKASATVNGVPVTLPVKQINRVRDDDGIYLYTQDFGPTTRTTLDGAHVVIETAGQLRVGAAVTGTVVGVINSKEAYILTPGQMVLSATNKGPADQLRRLTAGAQVTISVTAGDTRWQNCAFAVGGQYKLVTNGAISPGLMAGIAPRTAVGVKSDGSAVFYTVDGRQSEYSTGLSLADVAKRMINLGCTDVLELDGGGSTIMGAVYPGRNELKVLGKPSDGTPRKSSNYIFFVNNTPRYGTPDKVFVYPGSVTMLKNSTVSFEAAAADINYHAVSAAAPYWRTSDNYTGYINSAGVFTASESGWAQAYADLPPLTGAADIRVVDYVDSISVINDASGKAVTALTVNPGDLVNFSARAYLESVAVTGQDNSFTWTLAGNIGEIDEYGSFTASSVIGGSGTISVAYGNTVTNIQVSVGRLPDILRDFENSAHGFGGSENIQAALETDLTRVRYGKHSSKVTYDFGEFSSLTLTTELTLKNSPSYAYLWVYGDNSQNMLNLLFTDLANMPVELSAGIINYTGWKLINIQLPAGTAKFTGLRLLKADNSIVKGTIYVDQITAAYSAVPDVTPPVITLDTIDMMTTPGTMKISLNIADSDGAALDKNKIVLTYDGGITIFDYNTAACKLTASAAAPANDLHIISVEATDAAGNKARFSHAVEMPPSAPNAQRPPLTDMEGHWAKSFVSYLDSRGALTSKTTDTGREFMPDTKLTRSEMAVFITRVLKINTAIYDNTELPYTDLDKLPAAALPAIKAAYALGMIKGKSLNGGPPFFDPDGTVTRADFMTIAGRSLPKGYAVKELAFTDAASVPAYAKDHVEVMVSLGIVGGYSDNTLLPLRDVTRAEAAKMLFYFY